MAAARTEAMRSALPAMAPASTSLWPARYLVAECSTRSAPSARACAPPRPPPLNSAGPAALAALRSPALRCSVDRSARQTHLLLPPGIFLANCAKSPPGTPAGTLPQRVLASTSFGQRTRWLIGVAKVLSMHTTVFTAWHSSAMRGTSTHRKYLRPPPPPKPTQPGISCAHRCSPLSTSLRKHAY